MLKSIFTVTPISIVKPAFPIISPFLIDFVLVFRESADKTNHVRSRVLCKSRTLTFDIDGFHYIVVRQNAFIYAHLSRPSRIAIRLSYGISNTQ
jgi:hypothetical protein